MMWGRLIGACFAAAVTAALAGGFALFLTMLVAAQIANPGVGFDGPVAQQAAGAIGFLELLVLGSLFIGIMPALCGAFLVLLPLHLALARQGLTQRRWYLAAGFAGGLATTWLVSGYFHFLDEMMGTKGISPLLAVAALGGPVGALVFRRIVLGAAAKAAPTREK